MARVVALVDSAAHEIEVPAPPDAEVTWVHRNGGSADGKLAAAVRALDWPSGRVHVFVHGEAQEVMHGIRPYLFSERGVPRDSVSISGYWRQGRSEEGFRDWKSELARSDGDGVGEGGRDQKRFG